MFPDEEAANGGEVAVYRRLALAAWLAAALTAHGQAVTPERVYRIGVLEREGPDSAVFTAYRERLRELGYVEGRNLAFVFRSSEARDDRYPQLAKELVSAKVDLILGRGTPSILAAKKATSTIPIVIAGAGDPVRDGLVESLARPGGNVTGITAANAQLASKRVELLRELFPQIEEIGALANVTNPNVAGQQRELEDVARAAGIRLRIYAVDSAEDLQRAFEDAARQKVRAMYVSVDSMTLGHRKLIADLALKHRVATFAPSSEFVVAGGLGSYGPSYLALYRQAANVSHQILKGARPADIPVQQPTQFEFYLNAKTAKALKVTIPKHLLATADKVIE